MTRFTFVLFSLMLALMLPVSSAWSAEITKVKGKAVLIDLKGMAAASGDTFYAVDGQGKKKAILVVSKIKGEKAIAKISKGRAEVGMAVQAKAAGGSKASADSATASESTSRSSSKSSSMRANWGALFGFAMDNMTVDLKNNTGASRGSESMSGNSFSAKFLFDYRVFKQIWFRGTTGLESFSATGGAKCTESEDATCDVNIYYLSFDGLGRYMFNETDAFRPWVGGGFGLMFPVTKKSTALDSSSISNTSVMVVAGGLDWALPSGTYFPISIEYAMLPSSEDVKGNWIALRAGVAFPW